MTVDAPSDGSALILFQAEMKRPQQYAWDDETLTAHVRFRVNGLGAAWFRPTVGTRRLALGWHDVVGLTAGENTIVLEMKADDPTGGVPATLYVYSCRFSAVFLDD